MDNENKHTHECSVGDFQDEGTYHIAVKIGAKP